MPLGGAHEAETQHPIGHRRTPSTPRLGAERHGEGHVGYVGPQRRPLVVGSPRSPLLAHLPSWPVVVPQLRRVLTPSLFLRTVPPVQLRILHPHPIRYALI